MVRSLVPCLVLCQGCSSSTETAPTAGYVDEVRSDLDSGDHVDGDAVVELDGRRSHSDADPVEADAFSMIPDMASPESNPCPDDRVIWSGGGLELTRCSVRREGTRGAPMRGVVVSADSLASPFATSGHTATHFQELKQAGADFVWLLALWSGVEPREASLNGAYMGRVCEQGRMAEEAGLTVFLGMYLNDLGGVHPVGVPGWASEQLTDAGMDEAWRIFWSQYWDSYQNAWRRLARTCRTVLSGRHPALLGGSCFGYFARGWAREAECFNLERRGGRILR